MHWNLRIDTAQPVWWGHPNDPEQSSLFVERIDWSAFSEHYARRGAFWHLAFPVGVSSEGDDPEPLKRLAETIQRAIDDYERGVTAPAAARAIGGATDYEPITKHVHGAFVFPHVTEAQRREVEAIFAEDKSRVLADVMAQLNSLGISYRFTGRAASRTTDPTPTPEPDQSPRS